MKKNLFCLLAALNILVLAHSQKLAQSKVPAATLQAFQKEYPGISCKWDKEDGNYEANFTKEGKTMSAVIDAKGAILETETDIKVSELPKAVVDYINTHYKGANIKEAATVVKHDGASFYEAEVNKKDLIFDKEGNFVKEIKD